MSSKMSVRTFALVFASLYFIAALLVAGSSDLLTCLVVAIGTAASYALAFNLAERAINLGLVPPRRK